MAASRASNPARMAITLVMDLLVVWAVIDLVHLVVSFFGTLAHSSWGPSVLRLTSMCVLPFPVEDIPTPYGGVFDVAAAATILVLLLAEWVLATVRRTV